MATRPKGYGLTAEISSKVLLIFKKNDFNIFVCKIEGKFSQDLAQEAFEWMEVVTGKSVQPAPEDGGKVQEALNSGVILCEYGLIHWFVLLVMTKPPVD